MMFFHVAQFQQDGVDFFRWGGEFDCKLFTTSLGDITSAIIFWRMLPLVCLLLLVALSCAVSACWMLWAREVGQKSWPVDLCVIAHGWTDVGWICSHFHQFVSIDPSIPSANIHNPGRYLSIGLHEECQAFRNSPECLSPLYDDCHVFKVELLSFAIFISYLCCQLMLLKSSHKFLPGLLCFSQFLQSVWWLALARFLFAICCFVFDRIFRNDYRPVIHFDSPRLEWFRVLTFAVCGRFQLACTRLWDENI